MKLRPETYIGVATLIAVISVTNAAPPLSGAIFTTTVDGAIVNENVRYEKKEDVYLDGGPGPNAPSTAAALPMGEYYFQVTDPSGKDLLSSDHISCRRIAVNENGVIAQVFPGWNYEWQNGKNSAWSQTPCQHAQGIDQDHYDLGAITVQLFPYDDTPNPGGVYKAWITPVDDYACDDTAPPLEKQDSVNNEGCSQFHGFVPAASKTDNYKVKKHGKQFDPPEITIKKYHDKNNSGTLDEGDEEITGWAVDVTDPLPMTETIYTPQTVLAATPGIYSADEENPADTMHTFSYLDETLLTGVDDPVNVAVLGEDGETHSIWFGNVGLGSIKACKIFDKDTDGVADTGEPPIPGWMFELYAGADTSGDPIASGTAGDDGCYTFDGLPPGDYTVVELVADGYIASGPTSFLKTIVSTLDSSGPVLTGSSKTATFTNYCEVPPADFGTKGYWHNKNGLQELDEADVTYVNGLDPYDQASSYFGNGDEPFDGRFSDETPVAAAFNSSDGSMIWTAGTWQSEVSLFLVDSNATGDPAEQLAQQLLAFIFNVRNRFEGDGLLASIKLPGGSYVSAGDLISSAISTWSSGTDAEKVAMQELLNGFNESDSVNYIPGSPCSVNYSQ